MKPEHDESKLPLWARRELESLRMRRREAEKLLEQYITPASIAVSDTYVEHPLRHNSGYEWLALPKGSWVLFKLPNDREIRVVVDGYGVHVRGDVSLTLEPVSSNAVTVR